MLTRRQMVVGLGAAGLLAAGGAFTEVGLTASDRAHLFHRMGFSSSPDHHVPRSNAIEHRGRLTSRFMPQPVGWTITTPESAPAAAIVYCLHGKGTDHRMGFDRIRLPDVAAALGLPLSVAGVDGGPDSYWHLRADGSDSLRMFTTEFLPMVEATVGRLPRAILGWSMGGYGALLAAERTPSAFVAVAVASPALWVRPSDAAPGAFDSAADYRANDVYAGVASLAPLAVRVDCGTGDPFYGAARHLDALMRFPHTSRFGPGFHEDAYWRSVAPAQLTAIWDRISRRA